ncbi:MAG: radical SAM protein [Deltaproteobacteria bacterium]|nr:radical SAM protein [Deltaproteobacteria bacterium]
MEILKDGPLPPRMVFSDNEGRVYDHPSLYMAAQSGMKRVPGNADGLVPLPEGSQIFSLPGRYPVGWDPVAGRFVEVEEAVIDGRRVECTAVAAFLAPGYLRFLLPATALKGNHPVLPLWAYCAVGWREDGFWVSGTCVDSDPHWHPGFFGNDEELTTLVEEVLEQNPENRLLRHLSYCALGYHCFAAKNVFYRRWEAPLPTSPRCNARCLGCLSYQPPEGCEASHGRIPFVPTVEEVVEVALPHLEGAEAPIVSFGQGCEGEPLLEDRLLEGVVSALREKTSRGTVHLNTNGSLPRVVERLARAGLDSMRVTMASARPAGYGRYHLPQGYGLEDVLESIGRARARNIYVSLNLLVFPGFTDREDEIDSLLRLVQETGIDMIQMRNLNIDPDWCLRELGVSGAAGIGISNMLALLKERFPHLEIGYFNRPRESFKRGGERENGRFGDRGSGTPPRRG